MPRLRVVLRVCFCWRIRAAQGHRSTRRGADSESRSGWPGAHGAESGPSAGMGMTMIPPLAVMIPGKSGNRGWPRMIPNPRQIGDGDRDEDGDGGQLAADLVAWIVAIIVANSIPSSLHYSMPSESMVLQLNPRFLQIGDGDGDDPPGRSRKIGDGDGDGPPMFQSSARPGRAMPVIRLWAYLSITIELEI